MLFRKKDKSLYMCSTLFPQYFLFVGVESIDAELMDIDNYIVPLK